MFNVESLRSQSAPIKPLGTVPWILTIEKGEGIPFGLDEGDFVNWEGEGYFLTNVPIYPLSSSQRQVWEGGNQRILSLLVEASGSNELLEEGRVDEDGNPTDPDLSQSAKVSLMGVMAANGPLIRSIQSEMIERVLRVPEGSSELIGRVRGIGNAYTDLFAECFQAATELLAPKKKETDPNDPLPSKKRSR